MLCVGIGRAKAAVVLSVLAIATFHEEKAKGGRGPTPEDEPNMDSQSDDLFVEAVRLTHDETGVPQLESAQGRLLQVLYLLMSCRFNQAWYTFGHALQIISTLGLHRRDDRKRSASALKRDYIDEQCRKRTFWVAYTLDKYLGVIFGRPRHYHDEDIDQDFPDVVNDEDMSSIGPRGSPSEDCHIESLVCHARLAQIAERISREVYSIKPVCYCLLILRDDSADMLADPRSDSTCCFTPFSSRIARMAIVTPSIPGRGQSFQSDTSLSPTSHGTEALLLSCCHASSPALSSEEHPA